MENPATQRMYVVSMGKFTLLYFCTAGMYLLYWFYLGWLAVEKHKGRKLFPVGRALFSVFFVHEFFGFVRERQLAAGDEYLWQPAKLAWLFIGVNFFYVAVYLMAGTAQPHWLLSLLTFLMVQLVQFYVFYKVQLVINRIEGDPFGGANRTITLQNQLWMIFGAIFWVNVIQTTWLQATGQLTPAPVQTPVKTQPGATNRI